MAHAGHGLSCSQLQALCPTMEQLHQTRTLAECAVGLRVRDHDGILYKNSDQLSQRRLA